MKAQSLNVPVLFRSESTSPFEMIFCLCDVVPCRKGDSRAFLYLNNKIIGTYCMSYLEKFSTLGEADKQHYLLAGPEKIGRINTALHPNP